MFSIYYISALFLCWIIISLISNHCGTDLDWYLSYDFLDKIFSDQYSFFESHFKKESVSFLYITLARSLSEDMSSRAQLLSMFIGFPISSLTFLILYRLPSTSRFSLIAAFPSLLFCPVTFLSSEGMYRQAVSIFLFLVLIYVCCNYYRKLQIEYPNANNIPFSSIRFAPLSYKVSILTTFLLSLLSHKSFVFLFLNFILLLFLLKVFTDKRIVYPTIFSISPKKLKIIFIFLLAFLLLVLNVFYVSIGTTFFNLSSRQSWSGLAYFYILPLLFQLVISSRYILKSYSSHFTSLIFIAYICALCCIPPMLIFTSPEYFQRSYFFAMSLMPFTLASMPFKSLVIPFILYSFICLALLLSPTYNYLTSAC